MATNSSVFTGIDISLRSLEVALFEDKNIRSFSNNPEGISKLIAFLVDCH